MNNPIGMMHVKRQKRIDKMSEDIERILNGIISNHTYETMITMTEQQFRTFIRTDSRRVAHIFDLIPPSADLKILEVGIGYGYVAVPLRIMFPMCSVFALEAPGRDYVDSPTYKSMLEAHKITLRLADVTTAPFPFGDESFDIVIFSETMEHISPTGLPLVFSEIHRCLRLGGQVIITTPNVLRLRNRIRFLLGKTLFEPPTKLIGGTYGHIREYSHAEVTGLLSVCGFGQISTHRCSVRFPILFDMVDRLISRIGAMLSKFSIIFEDFVLVRAFRGK